MADYSVKDVLASGLRAWATDDIVPADLQELCKKAADMLDANEEDVRLLRALEAAGVDNWEGYEEIDLS